MNVLRPPFAAETAATKVRAAEDAWDINCSQHIHKRFSQRQVAGVVESLQERIAALEVELKAVRDMNHASQETPASH